MSKVSDAQLQDILEHIGNNRFIPQVVRQFDKSMLFSTDEKVVGQWIDGRVLYKKTIEFGTLPNTTTKSVAHGISNLGEVVAVDCVGNSSTNRISIPYTHTTHLSAQIKLDVDNTNVVIEDGYNFSGYTGVYVTIYYTKTTDTALPYELGDENDYSTTEKLVGKWIDGSDVFQHTFTVNIASGTSKTDFTTVNLSTAIADKVISCDILIDYGNGNTTTPKWKHHPSTTDETDEAYVYCNADHIIKMNYRMQSQLAITVYATVKYTKSS